MADRLPFNGPVEFNQGLKVNSGVSYLRGGFVFPQPAAEALADNGDPITDANIAARVMTIAAGDARSKAFPAAANLISTLGLTADNDAADLSIINTDTTTDHILTVTAGANTTIVGSPLCNPRVDGEDTIGSALFRVRRASSTTVQIFRIA